MSRINSLDPQSASAVVAADCNASEQTDLPFAECCAPRLAPTYVGKPIAESCNARGPTDKFVAECKKWMPLLASGLWTNKAPNTIHDLIGGDVVASLRTCYAWCAGTNEPHGFIVLKLLHSEQGWRVLEFLMRGCEQPWWIDLRRAHYCAAAYEREREHY